MAYSKEKIRLTVAVDKDLNEKLEMLSDVLGKSKTNIVVDIINQNFNTYAEAWKNINTVDKINAYIAGYNKQNLDTKELLKIKQILVTKPQLVNKANAMFSKLTEESKTNKKIKRSK